MQLLQLNESISNWQFKAAQVFDEYSFIVSVDDDVREVLACVVADNATQFRFWFALKFTPLTFDNSNSLPTNLIVFFHLFVLLKLFCIFRLFWNENGKNGLIFTSLIIFLRLENCDFDLVRCFADRQQCHRCQTVEITRRTIWTCEMSSEGQNKVNLILDAHRSYCTVLFHSLYCRHAHTFVSLTISSISNPSFALNCSRNALALLFNPIYTLFYEKLVRNLSRRVKKK